MYFVGHFQLGQAICSDSLPLKTATISPLYLHSLNLKILSRVEEGKSYCFTDECTKHHYIYVSLY